MGIYDRQYSRHDHSDYYYNRPRMGFGGITDAVKVLLGINIAVFLLTILPIPKLHSFIYDWFAVIPFKHSIYAALQWWRLISYQFLHSGFWHIALNMLGLFFLGPSLERAWGSRRFVMFYLGCGAVAGICYPLLVQVGFLNGYFADDSVLPLVGASGSILGMLSACAILFPQYVVFLYFFPVPIRVATIIITIGYLANLLSKGINAGGDAAHLGGMAAGAFYVYLPAIKRMIGNKIQIHSAYKINLDNGALHLEVDRILDKVSKQGIGSLTHKEKKTLKQATKLEQMKSKMQ